MALGPIIDVPILSIILAFIIKKRDSILDFLKKIPLNNFLVYILSSIPFIIIEEHINCIPEWCLSVILPPTIWFLLGVEIFFYVVFIKLIKITSFKKRLIIFCLLGIIIELVLGPSSSTLQALISSNPLVFLFMAVWVAISYLFIIIIPLLYLRNKEKYI